MTVNTDWKNICAVADITVDTGVCALFENEQVAIFRSKTNDDVYAISNFDPFSETNILSRGLIGSAGEKLFVASPLYKQRFNLKNGVCLDDEAVAIKTYSVRVDSGQVQLSA